MADTKYISKREQQELIDEMYEVMYEYEDKANKMAEMISEAEKRVKVIGFIQYD